MVAGISGASTALNPQWMAPHGQQCGRHVFFNRIKMEKRKEKEEKATTIFSQACALLFKPRLLQMKRPYRISIALRSTWTGACVVHLKPFNRNQDCAVNRILAILSHFHFLHTSKPHDVVYMQERKRLCYTGIHTRVRGEQGNGQRQRTPDSN